MSNTPYRHTQVGWVMVVVTVLVTALPVALVAQSGGTLLALLTGLPIAAIVGNMTTLTTWVTGDEIGLRFGLGIHRRRISARSVRSARIARPPALSGIGIRLVRSGWLYNVGPGRVVELDLDGGRTVMIGTDEPEALLAAVEAVTQSHQPTNGEAPAAGHLWRAILTTLLVLAVGGVPVLMGMRPVSVKLGNGSLRASGGFYSVTVPLSEVRSVIMLDTLPAIRRRTNGFAAGARLRGHFTLATGERVSLFVDRSTPPFIRIETAGEPILIGTADSARTRSLAVLLRAGGGERGPSQRP